MSRAQAAARRAYIAERLARRGRMNVDDVAGAFGVWRQTASGDMKTFLAEHPGAAVYDTRAKCYRRAEGQA